MSGDSSQAAREGFAARGSHAFVFHRDPQVGRKWSCIVRISAMTSSMAAVRIPWPLDKATDFDVIDARVSVRHS
jgi:hypothetical protein